MRKVKSLAAVWFLGLFGIFGGFSGFSIGLAQEAETDLKSGSASITADVVEVKTEGGEEVFIEAGKSDEVAAPVIEEPAVLKSTPKMIMYHGDGCPHCANQFKFLPVIEAMYPGVEIETPEVWKDPKNAKVLEKEMKDRGIERYGVPTNIIGTAENEQVVNGFNAENLAAAFEKVYGAPLLPLAKAIDAVGYDPNDIETESPTEENGETQSGADGETDEESQMGIWIALGVGLLAVLVLVFAVGKQD